jgi:hypothetical protein
MQIGEYPNPRVFRPVKFLLVASASPINNYLLAVYLQNRNLGRNSVVWISKKSPCRAAVQF